MIADEPIYSITSKITTTLLPKHPTFSYLGIDLSADMIRAAEQRHSGHPQARFMIATEPDRVADYGVASGIFRDCLFRQFLYLRLGRTDTGCHHHLGTTLDVLDRTSRRGFAFNCLTAYSDEEKKRDDLYYPDPCILFDLCKRRYSRQVALLHDYGLYDFTILVRKL